ncbi:MAG: HEPN domain-containing protein [Turicibacter sp.]|nr:HEPN domain-containing protein [Turicibacter sp.]
MNHYQNAQETERTAIGLVEIESYRHSIYMSCLACELYLKSKLHLVPHREELERSHDVVNIFVALAFRFKPKQGLLQKVERARKYFNESRYPYASDTSAYTKDFAEEFLQIVAEIRTYIDEDCLATLDDLRNKYQGGNPCEP